MSLTELSGSMPTPGMAQPGMHVFCCDAEEVGVVQEVHPDGLVVATKRFGQVTIPHALIAEVSESERRIDLTATQGELKQLRAATT